MTMGRFILAIVLLWTLLLLLAQAFQPSQLQQQRLLSRPTSSMATISHQRHVLSCSALRNSRNANNNVASESSPHITLKVGIAGAGAIAFATAAILSKNGHDVMLWSPSGKGTAELQGGRGMLYSTGAMEEYSFAPLIASSSKQLVEDNEVVMVCLPANGHKRVFDKLATYLATCKQQQQQKQHKHVIISSHASLGALYLMKAMEEVDDKQSLQEDVGKMPIMITAWGTTVCTARRTSGTSVDIKSIRKSVDLCTVPEQDSSSALAICRTLFPCTNFQPRDGLLAISLSNLNPQNHLGMALGNMSRMDKGEAWYQFQMTTPRIGKFLQDLDQERLDIADALGVNVKTIYDHFSLSFHVPVTDSISDMCQEIYKSGNDVYGPNTPFSRYITEDVPFGLALTVQLGRMVNRPAKLHEAGIMICNSMYDCNFTAENDLLQVLNLDQMSLEELQKAVRYGRTQRQLSSTSFLKL